MFAVVSVLLGDVLSSALDGALDFLSAEWFHPMSLATAITILGGCGLLLEKYSAMAWGAVLVLSILAALGGAVLIHLFYVRPVQNSETSSGFSVSELAGSLAEVLTPIPAEGYGEVMVRVGAAGRTNQIAASFDREAIEEGAMVVVVEVKEHTLYVSRFQSN
nr:NfeD family protein [Paenibacillus turpanensis]